MLYSSSYRDLARTVFKRHFSPPAIHEALSLASSRAGSEPHSDSSFDESPDFSSESQPKPVPG